MAEGGHDPRGQKINPSSEAKQRIIRAGGSGRRGASNETEGNQASSCLDENGISATAQVTGEGKTFRSVMERKRFFEDMKQALSARGSGRKEPTNETGGDQVSSGSEVSVRRATTHVAENSRRNKWSESPAEMSKKDNLKGRDQRGRDIKESAKPKAANNAVLAEGDEVSQNFENTTVSVIAGDQNNGTANGGQPQRGQLTKESPEANVARHATLAAGDQVIQNFTNATIYVAAGDIHVVPPSQSPEDKLDQERHRLQAEHGFLAKTKIHLQNVIGEHSTFTALPTMMVVDMKGTGAEGHGAGNSSFGRDLEEITLDQIHAQQNEKPTKHVTILGEAGAGKSTISKMYSLAVANGKFKTLDNIQLVHFFAAATLQTRSPMTAFDLLFTEQMAHDPATKLNLDEQEAGALWLENNSNKMMIIIDGLDQCLEKFGNEKYPTITALVPAKANDIIANIMSGKIWRNARVLTTSRWNTYWNITADQKPDKLVGLRGLDNKKLTEVASSQSIDGDSLLSQLMNTSPKLLTLCRNPMFLNYTTKIFKDNRNTLPNSLPSLMSEFFREFLSPSSAKYYDDVTKLAYNATLDNMFIFPHTYLRSQGIDPNVLDDFLSTRAIPDGGRETVTSFDKSSEFAHQTMQEFCCALHVPNLTRAEIKEFVTNQLNDSRMELTRQLLYGLILDEKVTKRMSNFLSNRRTSIKECEEILLQQLDGMIENGIIRDIQTVKLLSECGDETIRNTMNKVQRIIISDLPYLLQNDRLLFASMIKRLSPLVEVILNIFYLEPSLIQPVKEFLSSVDLFKVDQLLIEDTHLAHESVIGYLDIIRQWHGMLICLYECHLTTEKLRLIAQDCQMLKIQILSLTIFDAKMSADTYKKIACTLNSIGCKEMRFEGCDLTKDKLSEFSNGFKDNDLSLQELGIVDNSMKQDGYEILVHILKLSDCKELVLQNCCLTKTKLQGVLNGCRDQNIQIPELTVYDDTMPSDAYSELAAVVKASKCTYVYLGNCDLSNMKLACFGKGCKENQVSLQKLSIIDNSMNEDGYEILVHILKLSDCKELMLQDCCLTKTKLQGVLNGCRDQNIQLKEFSIIDNSMNEAGYEILAHILKQSDCKELVLQNCCLTKTKLQGVLNGCRDQNIQLQKLTIFDNTMPSDAYYDVAAVVKATKCTTVHFGQCDLSKQKLKCLGMGCKEGQVLIPDLRIDWSNSTATEDDISVLCDLMMFAVQQLVLFNWNIDAERRQKLKDTLHLEHSKIRDIQFPDGSRLYKSVSAPHTVSALHKIRKFFNIKRK